MSVSLEECYDCDAVFGDSMDPKCPVCKLRAEMEEKIEDLNDLIRSFHPLE
jgi:hypothetical protein